MRLLLFILLIIFLSCTNSNKIETYDNLRSQQIEQRDSLFILYTVKEWGKKMFYSWAVRTDIYNMTFDDIDYFIAGTFYSPNKKILLVWVGKKMPNVSTIKSYSENKSVNMLCPEGSDTVYSLTALIGLRDNINQIWRLYPFDQQSAGCFDKKEKVINILGQYYFTKMKNHEMYRIMQEGKRKGHKELQAYGYNLQDSDFWNNCWLFKKDTVGSYGLYPFQIKGYNYNGDKCTKDCAEPYNLPVIDYPEYILKLYK